VLKIALERPIPRMTRRPLKVQGERERQGYFEYIESHVAH
jgi:hypothetical protein